MYTAIEPITRNCYSSIKDPCENNRYVLFLLEGSDQWVIYNTNSLGNNGSLYLYSKRSCMACIIRYRVTFMRLPAALFAVRII